MFLVVLVSIAIIASLLLSFFYIKMKKATAALMKARVEELEQLTDHFEEKIRELDRTASSQGASDAIAAKDRLSQELHFLRGHLADARAVEQAFHNEQYPVPFLRPIVWGKQQL